MGKVGYSGWPMVSDMCVATTGAGETLTVGFEALPAILWTDADIATNIGAASVDLAAPSNWATLVTLSGGPLLVQLELYHNLYVAVAGAVEGAGEGIALKVTIDGTVVVQFYVLSDGGSTLYQYWYPPRSVDQTSSSSASLPIYCGTSFAIHAAYKGNGFTSSATAISVPLIRYKFVNPE